MDIVRFISNLEAIFNKFDKFNTKWTIWTIVELYLAIKWSEFVKLIHFRAEIGLFQSF